MMSPPPALQDGEGAAKITGVIFHAQARVGGMNSLKRQNVDPIVFNYSVDGGKTFVFKEPPEVSRMSMEGRWFDAYYDATEDRQWTWQDINGLAVKYMSQTKRQKDQAMMAAATVSIQYFQPLDTSPVFYAQVTDAACRELEFKTGIIEKDRPEGPGDVVVLRANPQLCAPTPTVVPTRAPTRVIARQAPPTLMPTPAATPTEVPPTVLVSQRPIGLGCLQATPNPFKRGGSFIYFCIKRGADITVNIYDGGDGSLVRELKVGYFGAGDHQVFFNARDTADKSIAKGTYIYEVVATTKDGQSQTANSSFKRED
jgi:hypothetical protein